MSTTTLDVSQTNLKQLLGKVKKGDEVILVQEGEPIARMLPYARPRTAPFVSENAAAEPAPHPFYGPSDDDPMEQEIAAYEAQHQSLVRDYLGQYVAIYQGRVVDHDLDQFQLLQRVNNHLPDEIVLIRRVAEALPQPLHIRSPRLLKTV